MRSPAEAPVVERRGARVVQEGRNTGSFGIRSKVRGGLWRR